MLVFSNFYFFFSNHVNITMFKRFHSLKHISGIWMSVLLSLKVGLHNPACLQHSRQIANKPDDKKKLLSRGQECNASASVQSNENRLTYKSVLKTHQQFTLTRVSRGSQTHRRRMIQKRCHLTLVNAAIVLQGF